MDLRKAINILSNKGIYVFNQFNGCSTDADIYEMWEGENIVKDHLTENDVINEAIAFEA